MDNIEKAKEIFLKYCGDKIKIKENNLLEEYENFNITTEIEMSFVKELKKDYLKAISKKNDAFFLTNLNDFLHISESYDEYSFFDDLLLILDRKIKKFDAKTILPSLKLLSLVLDKKACISNWPEEDIKIKTFIINTLDFLLEKGLDNTSAQRKDVKNEIKAFLEKEKQERKNIKQGQCIVCNVFKKIF